MNLIAIGASAGGLEALQDFLSHLPELNDSSILIAQHLSPTHKSMLVQLLSRETHLKVTEAENDLLIEPNNIYITPPDKEVMVKGKHIRLQKPSVQIGPKPSVDVLFQSLNQAEFEKIICIILSGTGSDGAYGIKSLSEKNVFLIAQDPETAKYNGMPSAAIQTGHIHCILPPSKMGKKILSYLNNDMQIDEEEEEINYEDEPSLTKVLSLLGRRTNTDFSNYKTATISRRLIKRMSSLRIENLEAYLDYMEKNPAEADEMFNTILIGVTQFFRDPESFKLLEANIARLISQKSPRDSIRVWIPGCSTGEEAYSIAILFNQILRDKAHLYNIQIFATDIDERAISFARKGLYSHQLIEALPLDIREKYFIKKGNDYELIKLIRSMVLFSKHDLIHNPPFLRLDLISCRNLLIYFNTALQQQIIPIFHYSLLQDGILFLGKSESIGQFTDLFQTIDSKNKLYQRKRGGNLHAIKFSAFRPQSFYSKPNTNSVKKAVQSISTMVKETLFNTYEHPYVVVNEDFEIQEIFGDIRLFVTLPSGSMQSNLVKMANPELQIELRSVLTKAIRDRIDLKSNIRAFKLFNKNY